MKYIVTGQLEDEEAFYGQHSIVNVEVDFTTIESEIESYAINYMDMGREDDFEPDAYKCHDDDLIEVLTNRGHSFIKNIILDNNLSIVEADALNTLLTNIEKIPISEIEEINKKYNLHNETRKNLFGYE